MDDSGRQPVRHGGAVVSAVAGSGAHGSRPPSSRHGRRSHRSSSAEHIHERHRRQRLVRRGLVAAVVILALAAGLLLALLLRSTTQLRLSRDQLAGEAQSARRHADGLQQTIDRLQAQLAESVQGRLPKPLLPMQLDHLVSLDEAPLHSILFTPVGNVDRLGYEYRLVCRNTGREPFQGAIRILVFNESGIQTGAAEVSNSPDWGRLGLAGLGSGESAAFSGRLTLQFNEAPRYFLVTTAPADGRLTQLRH